MVSLDDINIDQLPRGYHSWAYVIKSPRSLTAFRQARIQPKELDPIDRHALAKKLQVQYKNKFQIQSFVSQKIVGANDLRH